MRDFTNSSTICHLLPLPHCPTHLHCLKHDLADDAARVEAPRQERQEVAVLGEVLWGRGQAWLAAVQQRGQSVRSARSPAT